MYVGFLTTGSTVGATAPYVFSTKYITNTNIAYNTSTGVFTFREPGWYEVSFDTSGSAAGNITPTMYINNVASNHILGTATTTAGNDVNISFDSVLYLQPSMPGAYATMQIVNAGVEETVTTANIVIKRIG